MRQSTHEDRLCFFSAESSFPDAVMSDRVVALGQRADDRRLVGKILVERAEGDPGSLDDVAHPEGVAALFGHHLDRAGKDALEALAAALLGGNEPGESAGCPPSVSVDSVCVFRPAISSPKRLLTSLIREFIAFCKYEIFSCL